MSATKFTLSQTPTKILDGTKAAYIQEVSGSGTRFTSSTTAPDISIVPSCTIIKNDLSVSSGFPLWAWTPTTAPIVITVLTSES